MSHAHFSCVQLITSHTTIRDDGSIAHTTMYMYAQTQAREAYTLQPRRPDPLNTKDPVVTKADCGDASRCLGQ